MKNIKNKTKILIAIIAIIIIVGFTITLTIGLNFELKYQDTKRVELNLGKDFEMSDIKAITNEVFANKEVIIQKVEVFEDTVSIQAKDISEEEKTNLVNKINEKYQTELSAEEINIYAVPNTRGRDIVEPYIFPFALATLIILVYMAIRYHRLGIIKVLLKSAIIIVLAQALLLSVMAITRIPVGRLTLPLVIVVYIITLMGLSNNLERKLKEHAENNI